MREVGVRISPSLTAPGNWNHYVRFGKVAERLPVDNPVTTSAEKETTLGFSLLSVPLRYAELFLGLIVVLGALFSLLTAASRMGLPFQTDYAEGIVLEASRQILQGKSPYPPPGDTPYVINQYGPLFYYLVSALEALGGMGFAIPRLVVLLSGVVVSILLGLIIRRQGSSWRVGVIFAAFFLSLAVVRGWLVILRPDLIGLALALAGLALFSAEPRRLPLAIPFFLGAILCKASLLAAPGACWLFLLMRKEWKQALQLALGLGVSVLVALIWLQAQTEGGFLFHLVGSHAAPFSWSRYLRVMSLSVLFHLLPLFPAVILVIRDVKQRRPSLATIYLIVASAGTLTLLKVGAELNHLLEWLIAICLAGAMGYNWLRQPPNRTVTANLFALSLGIYVLVTMPLGAGSLDPRAECVHAYRYVEKHPGTHILSENVGALVLANKEVIISDPFSYAQLVRHSDWSDRQLVDQIHSRYFDLIIIDGDLSQLRVRAQQPLASEYRWPPSFVEALEENYQPTEQFLCQEAVTFFEPRR